MSFYAEKFKPGTKIANRYQVIEFLGDGAVGSVLRVSDLDLDKEEVALKVLHPHLASDPEVIERFQNEVAITRQLSHPNIVRVFDFDCVEEEGLYFISMECVKGPSLKEYLDIHKGRRLSWQDSVRILHQIASGLSFAHQKKIIHRDIKLSNILISFDGSAKLSDFGIARSLEASHGLTRTGESLGTPQYMSPEQFSGSQIDAQSDIYSLGVLAYELVTGELPFEGENFVSLAHQHISQAFPEDTLSELQIPSFYRELLGRCSAKEKSERFENCGELIEFLKKGAFQTLEHPRLELSKHLPGKSLFHSYLPPRLKILIQILLFALLFAVFFLTEKEAVPRQLLFAEIFKIEAAFGWNLTTIKSWYGLEEYSVQDKYVMHKAVQNQNHKVIHALAWAGLASHVKNEAGETPAHLVARSGWLEGVAVLFEVGADLDEKNNDGETPLLVAIKNSKSRVSRKFISLGANPNLTDRKNNSALHFAAMHQDSASVTELLRQSTIGLYWNKETELIPKRSWRYDKLSWKSPLLKAYIEKDSQAIEMIRSSNDCATATWRVNDSGNTPLHIAVRNEDLRSAGQMTRRGAYADVRDSQGRTPLMIAVSEGEWHIEEMCKLLAQGGADFWAIDKHGRDVSAYARAQKTKELIEGVKINHQKALRAKETKNSKLAQGNNRS